MASCVHSIAGGLVGSCVLVSVAKPICGSFVFLQAALNERIERGLEMPLLTAGFGRMKKAGSSLDEPAFEGGVLSHFLFRQFI